jgi:hypothetical protein
MTPVNPLGKEEETMAIKYIRVNGFCSGVYVYDIGSVHSQEVEKPEWKLAFEILRVFDLSGRCHITGVLNNSQQYERRKLKKFGAKLSGAINSKDLVSFILNRGDFKSYLLKINKADLVDSTTYCLSYETDGVEKISESFINTHYISNPIKGCKYARYSGDCIKQNSLYIPDVWQEQLRNVYVGYVFQQGGKLFRVYNNYAEEEDRKLYYREITEAGTFKPEAVEHPLEHYYTTTVKVLSKYLKRGAR